MQVLEDDLLQRKIERATEGLPYYCRTCLAVRVTNKENAAIICDYISSMIDEVNPADSYRRDVIILLTWISVFFNNSMGFKEITRENILSFLDSFRKPEASDPLHKWIGTYNTFRIHLMRFLRWLHYPDVENGKRPIPPVLENIPQLRRKEKSTYKPTDVWTEEEDALFLKYCPNARDRLYFSMSRDTSARPHELLKCRIRDVLIKITPDK